MAKDNDDSNDSTVNITTMPMITLIMFMIAIMVTTIIMILVSNNDNVNDDVYDSYNDRRIWTLKANGLRT